MASGLFETFYTSLGLGLQFLGSYCFFNLLLCAQQPSSGFYPVTSFIKLSEV